jgi:tetratricopeptide (TPR) repeat protein
MPRFFSWFLASTLFCGVWPVSAQAQASQTAAGSDISALAQHGISLTEKGACKEALPVLKKATPRLLDKQLKYHAVMALARCAMSLDQNETAVTALLLLNREFPNDPEVLYVTTHYYSELASRASRQLVATSPASYQVHELDAEGYESQGKWEEATAEYRKILEQDPQRPEIHYRLGRILLAKPATPMTNDEARKEFEQELKINPDNASAEFMLGEIARQAGDWNEAIQRFSRSIKLDEGFSDAYLALGMSLSSAGRFSDAIPPLQKYVGMEAADPGGHYQLAIAYSRTGQKQEATREMSLQTQAAKAAGNSQAAPNSSQ